MFIKFLDCYFSMAKSLFYRIYYFTKEVTFDDSPVINCIGKLNKICQDGNELIEHELTFCEASSKFSRIDDSLFIKNIYNKFGAIGEYHTTLICTNRVNSGLIKGLREFYGKERFVKVIS